MRPSIMTATDLFLPLGHTCEARCAEEHVLTTRVAGSFLLRLLEILCTEITKEADDSCCDCPREHRRTPVIQ
jgi:hypothetical protein